MMQTFLFPIKKGFVGFKILKKKAEFLLELIFGFSKILRELIEPYQSIAK